MVAFKAIAKLLARISVFAAALALIVAAAIKVQDTATFHDVLAAHGILPAFSLGVAPWLIIALEACVGLGVLWSIIGGRWRVAAQLSAAIFFCFTVYTAGLAIRPPSAPTSCGCGYGGAIVDDWTPLAIRNAAIAAGLFFAMFFVQNAPSIPVFLNSDVSRGDTPHALPRKYAPGDH